MERGQSPLGIRAGSRPSCPLQAGLCGRPSPIVDETPYRRTAKIVARIPAWVFHGNGDQNVLAGESREIVKLLREMNANIRYTEYEGVAHFGSWDRAYDDPELPQWLFAQKLLHVNSP